VSRPTNRNARIAEMGEVDSEAGEFWVENPFQVAATGHNLSAFERNRLFLNIGGQEFLDASFASAADIDSDSRSVVAADFDGDLAQDLLVVSVGGGPVRLFLNRLPPANRLRVDLQGVESNRSGIGSRIVAEIGDRQLVRDVFPANGAMGQGPVEMILGLGTAERVDRLSIRWPTGSTQSFTDLPANGRITVTEGRDDYELAVPNPG
jgi:hypothetical protein